MKHWLRLLLILLTVGGGFCGFAITWQSLCNVLKSSGNNPVNIILLVIFLALYGLAVASGLVFSQDQRKSAFLFASLILQIPWVSSPVFSYRFTAGLHATVGVVGGNWIGGISLGSDWQCALFQQAPWGFGLNLFAVFMLILLAQSVRTSKRDLEPTITQSSR